MTTAPAELTYGYVDGRLILVVGDTGDAGRMPDPVPATGTTVQITPKQPLIRIAGDDPTIVVKQSVTCTLDEDGRLLDPAGERGVWLVTGIYTVTYRSPAATIPNHEIVVTAAHTESSPLDLTLAMPPGGPVLTPSQYAELSARIDGLTFEAAGVTSVNGQAGTVVLDAEDVGALPSWYTPPAQSWSQITEKPEAFAPTAHAASHATDGSDPVTPADIGAATAAQGAKADSAVQPADVDDVIREGDTRLTDARTPTAHGHAYSEITGTPTIPGPQTLSLTGSDLTLSDGGGTVTLPAGGGGGGSASLLTRSLGGLPGRPLTASQANLSIVTEALAIGSVFEIDSSRTLTRLVGSVATAAVEGSVAYVGIYTYDLLTGNASLHADLGTVAIDVSGQQQFSIIPTGGLVLPAGVYCAVIVPSSAVTLRALRVYDALHGFQSVQEFNAGTNRVYAFPAKAVAAGSLPASIPSMSGITNNGGINGSSLSWCALRFGD